MAQVPEKPYKLCKDYIMEREDLRVTPHGIQQCSGAHWTRFADFNDINRCLDFEWFAEIS